MKGKFGSGLFSPFVNAGFNFEAPEYLGSWDLSGDDYLEAWGHWPTHLSNGDFRNFKRHGYGRDLPVLSRLHKSTKFKPDCWRARNVK